MNLQLSTRYGLYAAAELAKAREAEPLTVARVADVYGFPEAALAKVFQRLVRQGIAVGTRGSGGGYHLSRSPSEITLLEIIEAFEAVGSPDVDALFDCVPEKLRLGRPLELPAAASEQERIKVKAEVDAERRKLLEDRDQLEERMREEKEQVRLQMEEETESKNNMISSLNEEKNRTKAPKIQRLVTKNRLQRKRRVQKQMIAKVSANREARVDYFHLLHDHHVAEKEKRHADMAKKKKGKAVKKV